MLDDLAERRRPAAGASSASASTPRTARVRMVDTLLAGRALAAGELAHQAG